MSSPAPPRIVIVGGGIIGSCIAYFLARTGGGGDVCVLEPDPDHTRSSTARSASAIRVQFNLGINVTMALDGYDFFRRAPDLLSVDGETVDISFETCPYLVLAAPAGVTRLRRAYERQRRNGADVELLLPQDLSERVPWLVTDRVGAAVLGRSGEGWFEPRTALLALRRKAESLGVTYVPQPAVDLHVDDGRVVGVVLGDGARLPTTAVVNAAGARAARVAALAGVALPVESRKRSAFVFKVESPPRSFTNLVDPTFDGRGVYARPYGEHFLAVTAPLPGDDPDTDDLEPDVNLFHHVVRPALSRRVRGFQGMELVDAWAGHYEMNTFDQNAILGRHPLIGNLVFACGLSGHGVMHAPAIGRGIAELLRTGGYRTLDLTPFRFERVQDDAPLDDVQPSERHEDGAGL